MPSPRGTNHAGLYILARHNPVAAYDSADGLARHNPTMAYDSADGLNLKGNQMFHVQKKKIARDDDAGLMRQIMDFLRTKLTDDDILELQTMIGESKDESAPAAGHLMAAISDTSKGKPEMGNKPAPAMDRALATSTYEAMFPGASRIGTAW